jgi:hypothetical protein
MALNKKQYIKQWRKANREILAEKKHAYYLANKEKLKARSVEWNKNNKERKSLKGKLYYEKTKKKTKAADKKRISEWKSRNKGKLRFYWATRKAAKLQQTPKWADLNAIKEFYINCPEGYHVDHIIPLQGKNVRGLHVLENLQYLTRSENCSKGNKFNG